MRWRVAGVLFRPRKTMADLAARPAWVAPWLVILGIWAACGVWLLSTPIGRQALVDERVRSVEAFGGSISDRQYEALQARPPLSVYLTSGGRVPLLPPVTVLAAGVLWLACRPTGSFGQALAVAVHASAALLVGQVIATPLHYGRESLTSPFNIAALVPLLDEGTLPARMLGGIDIFALWWLGLLALGAAAITGRPFGGFLVRGLGIYVGLAAVLAIVQVMSGGS